jgi:hypothetical protein
MEQSPRFVHALVDGSNARLRRTITELIAAVIRRELGHGRTGTAGSRTDAARELDAERERLLRAEAHTLAAAFLGLAEWWRREGRGLAPESVDRIFQRTAGGASSPARREGV